MNLDKYSNTVSRAIAIAGIAAAAMTGCKPAEKEITQRDEQVEMVKKTRKSIGNKNYEVAPWGVVLKGKQGITLPRPLLEKAKAEKKLILPGEVDDIGSLSGVPIEELEIDDSGYVSRLKDLSPLRGAPLKKINIHRSLVEDIEALHGMPLEEVDISSTAISDLTPLKDAKLKVLKIDCSPIESLEPVRGMPLEVFHMGSNNCLNFSVQVQDLSPLEDCPLKEAMLSRFMSNSELPILKGKPIEVLYIDKTNVKDLSVLKGMPLRILNLRFTDVENLEPLRGMKLKRLWLGWTSVTDLSPLAGMPLEHLELYDLPVTDLSPLAGMPLKYLGLNESGDLRPIKDIVDRLRKTEGGLNIPPCSKVNWDTYQLELKEGKDKPRDCNY